MKFLAIAAALVVSVAASPSGGPGYGYGGGWGGHGFNGFGGGSWGLRNPVDFQTASNVCGSGNTVMCCNESQYREDFNSNNAGLLGLMNGLEGPGTGLFGQCNNFNIGSSGIINDHCSTTTACCQDNSQGGFNARPCTALAAML